MCRRSRTLQVAVLAAAISRRRAVRMDSQGTPERRHLRVVIQIAVASGYN